MSALRLLDGDFPVWAIVFVLQSCDGILGFAELGKVFSENMCRKDVVLVCSQESLYRLSSDKLNSFIHLFVRPYSSSLQILIMSLLVANERRGGKYCTSSKQRPSLSSE
jgi:hypothetical protein